MWLGLPQSQCQVVSEKGEMWVPMERSRHSEAWGALWAASVREAAEMLAKWTT